LFFRGLFAHESVCWSSGMFILGRVI
jgi:hypothetical protein